MHKVAGFEWDEGNSWKSLLKHNVTMSEAQEVFANAPLLVADDIKHSQLEIRLQALGRTNEGRCLQLTFTLRQNGELIRVISARPMNKKEKEIYDEQSA